MSAPSRNHTAAVLSSAGFGLGASTARNSAQKEHAFVTMLLALYPAVASVAVAVAAFYAGGLPA
jgi:hypothetical protein